MTVGKKKKTGKFGKVQSFGENFWGGKRREGVVGKCHVKFLGKRWGPKMRQKGGNRQGRFLEKGSGP